MSDKNEAKSINELLSEAKTLLFLAYQQSEEKRWGITRQQTPQQMRESPSHYLLLEEQRKEWLEISDEIHILRQRCQEAIRMVWTAQQREEAEKDRDK